MPFNEENPLMQASIPATKLSWKLVLLGLLVVGLDQLIKGWVVTHLPLMDSSFYWYPYGGIGIFKNFLGIEFSLNHITNTGAAWGVLGNYQLPLIILRLFLISGLALYLFRFNKNANWQLPLILITAGAISNVMDFFFYGHVIDMFHFVLGSYDFPVFNLADSAISIGIVWLFFLSWMSSGSDEQSKQLNS
jgi:signal peptidase II